jgi:hypothetical protein
MKKLLPYLALAALALTIVAPHSAHAILDIGDLLTPDGGGGGAPEIDRSALGSAIALVLGGAAMLTDRFRR